MDNAWCMPRPLWLQLGGVLILLLALWSLYTPAMMGGPSTGDAEGAVQLASADGSSSLKLRTMTYNIRRAQGLDGITDVQRIAAEIERAAPDIAALQEVDRFHIRSKLEDQASRLGEALGMYWYYADSMRIGPMHYGNLILSRYPIMSGEAVRLPGSVEQRTVLKAVIDVNGIPVTVYNTHLGLYKAERDRQLPELIQFLEETEGTALLMGDFNTSPHDSSLQVLSGWRQLEQQSERAMSIVSGGELDHIYLRSPEAICLYEAWHVVSDASDHYPVVAELTLHFPDESYA